MFESPKSIEDQRSERASAVAFLIYIRLHLKTSRKGDRERWRVKRERDGEMDDIVAFL